MAPRDHRAQIDAVDDRILALLSRRARLVGEELGTRRGLPGAPAHDPEREHATLERVASRGAEPFPREAIRAVFRAVLSGCLSQQEPVTVAFLGPEGTFSHMAARHLFGLAARYRAATSIAGVFDAIERGDAASGVVPIENSTEGSVTWTLDALLETPLRIREELVLEVAQCLLSRAPDLTAIERVYSHPQALAQCRVWLGQHLGGAQLVQTTSTAAAAREALADVSAAAIASRLASVLHNLPVMREGIQDRAENATRFLVLAASDAPRTGRDKTTLAFSLRDERGALRRVLEVFDRHGINLSRIESRPSRHKAWEYVFFADLEGHREDREVAEAIASLESVCEMVKVCGSYPRHPSEEADR